MLVEGSCWPPGDTTMTTQSHTRGPEGRGHHGPWGSCQQCGRKGLSRVWPVLPCGVGSWGTRVYTPLPSVQRVWEASRASGLPGAPRDQRPLSRAHPWTSPRSPGARGQALFCLVCGLSLNVLEGAVLLVLGVLLPRPLTPQDLRGRRPGPSAAHLLGPGVCCRPAPAQWVGPCSHRAGREGGWVAMGRRCDLRAAGDTWPAWHTDRQVASAPCPGLPTRLPPSICGHTGRRLDTLLLACTRCTWGPDSVSLSVRDPPILHLHGAFWSAGRGFRPSPVEAQPDPTWWAAAARGEGASSLSPPAGGQRDRSLVHRRVKREVGSRGQEEPLEESPRPPAHPHLGTLPKETGTRSPQVTAA